MTDLHRDVAIIGAGTAGLAAERSARKRKAKTILIDDRFAGTTCADVGCMPSKLLIAAADAAHAVRHAGVFGVSGPAPVVDGKAVMARVRRLRDEFVKGAKTSYSELPDGVLLQGRVRFADRTTLLLEDGRRVTAKATVIATGSRPSIPPAFGTVRDRVLTNENIFELDELPRSLAVVGAGPIGLELGQAMARLGVETMLFGDGKLIGGLKDPEVSEALRAIIAGELPVVLDAKVEARPDGDGVRLSWGDESRYFDRVLVATGRPPQLKGLELEKTGLALDDRGVPHFDRGTMQCSDACIFIAGDANDDRPVLHEAHLQGTIAGRNAATFPEVKPGKRALPFTIVFSDPPVAVVGAPPDESTVTGKADYANQGRTKVFARSGGIAHLYADAKTGRLTGAAIAAPAADHLGHLIACAVEHGVTASAMLDSPLYHPTYEEGMKPALRQICAHVNAPESLDRDDGFVPGF